MVLKMDDHPRQRFRMTSWQTLRMGGLPLIAVEIRECFECI